MIQMLDTALNMLGPDIELLSEIMKELGEKHVRYGVKPEYFPLMEEALFYALENTLKSGFDEPHRQAWRLTYSALSTDMMAAHQKK
jgi:hemoglobin-like flavoprotein